jgi:hypothetical protein
MNSSGINFKFVWKFYSGERVDVKNKRRLIEVTNELLLYNNHVGKRESQRMTVMT